MNETGTPTAAARAVAEWWGRQHDAHLDDVKFGHSMATAADR